MDMLGRSRSGLMLLAFYSPNGGATGTVVFPLMWLYAGGVSVHLMLLVYWLVLRFRLVSMYWFVVWLSSFLFSLLCCIRTHVICCLFGCPLLGLLVVKLPSFVFKIILLDSMLISG